MANARRDNDRNQNRQRRDGDRENDYNDYDDGGRDSMMGPQPGGRRPEDDFAMHNAAAMGGGMGFPRHFQEPEYRRNQGGYQGRGYDGWSDDRGYGSGRGNRNNERGMMDRAGDEVASWFGDEDAQRRREEDHRGKGPRGYQRSDARILEDVNDRLSDDYSVDASAIDVEVSSGEVTLSGEVTSKAAKRRAEDCADAVSGVSHVQNNLRVKRQDGSEGQTASGL